MGSMTEPRSLYEQMIERLCLELTIRPIAEEYGVDAEGLLEDCRRLFSLSDEEQDREFERMIAEAEAAGDEEDVRVMREGWDAIRSYR